MSQLGDSISLAILGVLIFSLFGLGLVGYKFF